MSEKAAADSLADYLANETAPPGELDVGVTGGGGGVVGTPDSHTPSSAAAASTLPTASGSPTPGDSANSPATPGSPRGGELDVEVNGGHFDDDDDAEDDYLDDDDGEGEGDDGGEEDGEEGGEYSHGIRTTSYDIDLDLDDDLEAGTPASAISSTSASTGLDARAPPVLPDGASPGNFTSRCRPFKCSLCGRRSNWKWDVTKHIKVCLFVCLYIYLILI